MMGNLSPKNIYQNFFYRLFEPMHNGRLLMVLPDGAKWSFGAGNGVHAEIKVRDDAFFKRCILFGDIGFAESYIDGQWETEDITKVIQWMIFNIEDHPTLMDNKQKKMPVNFFMFVNKIYYALRANTLKGSRRNIQEHYDLSNDFFEVFLDPTMTYSAAYYKNENNSLEEAQINKYDALCNKLRLKPGDRVLEIGSGWGGFATHAAKKYDCRIDTVTISQQQYRYATERIQNEKLAGQVKVKLMDYRSLRGVYDKIVSIEMIEAVGHSFLRKFFEQCHHLLKKDGILALQMILSPDHRYDSFRKNPDFIQKYIFPGSLLPSIDVIQKNIRKTGTLVLHSFEDITPHYVKTLSQWKDNFNANIKKIKELGFNDAFTRKWNYYFSYCEAAFYMRNISVAQAVFSRPNNLNLSR
jgi:cyclopropane-fatty-acyl-phospholipid synthase